MEASEIRYLSVTNDHLAPNSVTGDKVWDGSVTGSDVAANSLLGSDVANGTLEGIDVKDGSLEGTDVKDGSVGLARLAVKDVFVSVPNQIPAGEFELAQRLDDRTRATDRACRSVEGCEETVAGGVELPPSEAEELAAHDGVVTLEQLAPAAVTERADLF